MLDETEIKIRLNSNEQFAAVLSRCQGLYGTGAETVQRDEYFDTPEEILKDKDYTVRLRIAGQTVKVALKSPRIYLPDNIYRRIELEFSASNESEVREDIRRQGLIAAAIIEKRRWKFKSDDLKVTIDKLPFIGTFIEIEAPTPQRINKILTLLQLSTTDAVRENYTELIEVKLRELGLPLRPNLRATFEAETEFRDKLD